MDPEFQRVSEATLLTIYSHACVYDDRDIARRSSLLLLDVDPTAQKPSADIDDDAWSRLVR